MYMRNRVLWLMIISFILYFFFLASARHENFYSLRLDLGNMYQTVWNVANGNGFTLTDPYGTAQLSRVSIHADFLLIALAPLWHIWKDPAMLLFIQTVIVAFGSMAVFSIAKDRTSSPWLGVLFAGLYLLYPPLERVVLHDFHAVALSSTFLLFAYVFLYKKNTLGFVVLSIMAALGKEQVWLVVALLSGFGVWKGYISRTVGIVLMVAFFAVFYALFWHVIPGASFSGTHFALTYLSQYGETTSGVVVNIFTQPFQVFRNITSPDRMYYLFQLVFPVAFFSMFAPMYLVFALPGLLINMLSSNLHMRIIDYQYTSTVTPFIFIAAVEGFVRLRKKISTGLLVLCACVCGIAGSYAWGELPYGKESRYTYFTTKPKHLAVMQQMEDLADPMYTVSATNNVGAHFAGREILYPFPEGALVADLVIVRLGDRFAWPSGIVQEATVAALLKNDRYELVAKEGEFYAFRKKDL